MVNLEKLGKSTVYFKSSEKMSELEDNSIDVIITSPPYNRGKVYSDDSGGIYNDKKSKSEYYQLLTNVWTECFRVLKPEGTFFLNIGDSANDQGLSEEVVNLTSNVGFFRIQTIIWVKSLLGKGHYTPSGGNRRLNNVWESIFLLVKNKKKYRLYPKAIGIPYADRSNIGRYSEENLRDPGNVWLIPYLQTTGSTIKKGHEAPFPIELPYKCIQLTNAETVLDPFAGTGSTLAAANSLGKVSFGYEKYPRKNIIRNTVLNAQPRLTPTILLPHLELTASILTKLCQKLDYDFLKESCTFKFTKKEQVELEILKETLKELDLNLPILNRYFSDCSNLEKFEDRKLDDFF
ncbi:MAG: site-specific DNA-methyltransferase [Candidatus Heimdallarchaeota archaeon]|nr:site-specific DNA-methyltransferase [Candidatus Heimdallarchaeota archaeon]